MDQDILQRFGEIWPRHVDHHTRFLLECRRHFDGDLDLFLIMSIVGCMTFSAHHADATLDYDTWRDKGVRGLTKLKINAQSIADFSGIPRETVRRKLLDLMDRGWVCRDASGFLAATEKAKADLEPLTLVSLKYLTNVKAVISTAE